MDEDNRRIDRILNNDRYIEQITEIEKLEKGRPFCKHGLEHCLNVARIMMILNYEERLMISKESIYTVALLHDIGRGMQYLEGIPHEEAGEKIAGEILRDAGYTLPEIEDITRAIGHHRNSLIQEEHSLSGILYRADKLSRTCFACQAESECDWDSNKKNMRLKY